MKYDNSIPEMSADFCSRVVAKSWDIKQRSPLTWRAIRDKVQSMLPVRINIAVAMMAVVFVVGMFIGAEGYTYVYSDDMDISQILEI